MVFTNTSGEKLYLTKEQTDLGSKRITLNSSDLVFESESDSLGDKLTNFSGQTDSPIFSEFRSVLSAVMAHSITPDTFDYTKSGSAGFASKTDGPLCAAASATLDLAEVTFEFTCSTSPDPGFFCRNLETNIEGYRTIRDVACGTGDSSSSGSTSTTNGGAGSGGVTSINMGGRTITIIGSSGAPSSGGGSLTCIDLPDGTLQCTLRLN